MPTSDARIRANQANAAKSTGPKTAEGKEQSRRNSLKHGLTGAGIVLPETDAAEVERRTAKYADELVAIGEVGQFLARCAALNSVRVERGADQQTAALSVRVRQVAEDFVPPTGADDAETDKLRAEAIRVAMFDPSPEATLARRYQAAAERSFYKAVKQLRQMELQGEALAKADDEARINEMMGSFFQAQREGRAIDEGLDEIEAQLDRSIGKLAAKSAYFTPSMPSNDLPFPIGRSR